VRSWPGRGLWKKHQDKRKCRLHCRCCFHHDHLLVPFWLSCCMRADCMVPTKFVRQVRNDSNVCSRRRMCTCVPLVSRASGVRITYMQPCSGVHSTFARAPPSTLHRPVLPWQPVFIEFLANHVGVAGRLKFLPSERGTLRSS
jgi:hypothetical protein